MINNWMSPVLKRILWKEIHSQGSLFLAVLTLGIVWQSFIAIQAEAHAVWIVAAVLPTFFAIGAGAISFAGESEGGTRDLYRIWSVHPAELLLGKLVVSFTGCLVTVVLLHGLPLVLLRSWMLESSIAQSPTSEFEMFLASPVRCAVELLLFTMLLSTFTASPIRAACMGAGVWLLATLALAWFRDIFQSGSVAEPFPIYVLPFLLLLNLLATRKWLLTEQMNLSWLVSIPSWKLGSRGTSALLRSERGAMWLRRGRRLFWLEWLEIRFAFPVIAIASVGYLYFQCIHKDHPDVTLAYLYAVVGPWSDVAFGVWAFRSHGKTIGYTFLVERGASPFLVWAIKQMTWLATAMLSKLVLLAVVWYVANVSFDYGRLVILITYYLSPSYFIGGQIASIVLPWAVVAAIAGYWITKLSSAATELVFGFKPWFHYDYPMLLVVYLAAIPLLISYLLMYFKLSGRDFSYRPRPE